MGASKQQQNTRSRQNPSPKRTHNFFVPLLAPRLAIRQWVVHCARLVQLTNPAQVQTNPGAGGWAQYYTSTHQCFLQGGWAGKNTQALMLTYSASNHLVSSPPEDLSQNGTCKQSDAWRAVGHAKLCLVTIRKLLVTCQQNNVLCVLSV